MNRMFLFNHMNWSFARSAHIYTDNSTQGSDAKSNEYKQELGAAKPCIHSKKANKQNEHRIA